MKGERVFKTPDALEAVLLGELGYSNLYIRGATGLSDSAIGYRLKLANVRRKDYRNGESPVAQMVLRLVRPQVTPLARRTIKKCLDQ